MKLLPSPAPSEEPSDEEYVSSSDIGGQRYMDGNGALYKDSAGTQPILTNKGNQVILGDVYLTQITPASQSHDPWRVYNLKTSTENTILIRGGYADGTRAAYGYYTISGITNYNIFGLNEDFSDYLDVGDITYL